MARVSTDLFNLGKILYGFLPRGQQVNILLYGGLITSTTTVALTSSLGYKLVRWIKRDPTHYVAWKDLQGQIDRLAIDRFEQMKGALAPAAIFDRKGLAFYEPLKNGLSKFRDSLKNNVYLLGGTAALAWTMLSLNECMKNGDTLDSQSDQQCWNHLASFFYDPVMLPALATLYSAGSGAGFTIALTGATGMLGVAIIDGMSQGWTSPYLPTMLRGKAMLLTERYEALAKKMTEDWNKIKAGQDAEAKARFIKQATLLKRREQLITLGLTEHFSLDQKASEKLVAPLIAAASKIIREEEKA